MALKGKSGLWACAWWLAAAMSVLLAGCKQPPQELQISPTRAYVDARSTLLGSAEDPDPRIRANALEALALTEGQRAGGRYMQSLKDDRLPVVSAAAMAVGECRYAPAEPVLLTLAGDPRTPPKLLCSAIYALHRLGNDTHTGQLAQLLRHRDKFVRAEAARVMGKMGQPSAVGPLKALQRDDLEVVVRLNVAEALALLGDDRSLGLLEAFTKSQFVEDRLIAVEALGKLRHMRSIAVLRRVVRDKAQGPIVRVAAAGSLAMLGQRDGRELVCQAAQDPEGVLRRERGRRARVETKDVTTLQTLAVRSLEQMGNELAVSMIHPLLRSSRGPVKVAAARAILRLLRAYCPDTAARAPSPAPLRTARTPSPAPAPTAQPPAPAPAPTAQPEPPAPQPTTRPKPKPKLHSAGPKD